MLELQLPLRASHGFYIQDPGGAREHLFELRVEPDSDSLEASDVVECLRLESPDGDSIDTGGLSFLRTAQVADKRYWIWALQEADGSRCYVTVAISPEGRSCIGYEENYYELTPEQFMLGDDHQVF